MFSCECGFQCARAFNLERHRSSKAHKINMMEINIKSCKNDDTSEYFCAACDYSTRFTTNFRKHVRSVKHKQQQHVAASFAQDVTATMDNSMDSSVTTRGGDEDHEVMVKPVSLIEVMEMFMRHQSEQMKQQTDNQTEQLKHQSIQNTEMFKALAERIAAQQSATAMVMPQNLVLERNDNSQNTTTTNSHNKKFNLNFFLNEECKNAMNISEFIQNVVITMEDLEHFGEVGYTEGMSKILSKAMQEKEKTERPMHCTDVKRETIYVRKNDSWQKDTELEETKRLIQHVAHKNYKALAEWRDHHPEYLVSDSDDYESWYRISRNICNTDPAALNKLIRHLAMVSALDRDGV